MVKEEQGHNSKIVKINIDTAKSVKSNTFQ